MTLDNSLSAKLKAMNCAFSLVGNTLTVEPGLSIKTDKKVVKNAKPIKKQIVAHYPNAVCLTVNDIGGFRVIADLL